jgi:hypothetical protein
MKNRASNIKQWPDQFQKLAAAEGWDLFECEEEDECQLQREDDLDLFSTDDEALAFVKARAAAGSELHALALRLCGED